MDDRKVVSQGMISGLIYLLLYFLFITQIPLINLLALLTLPLPIIYFTAKYGLKPGLLVTAVVGLLGTFISAGLFLLPIGFAAIGLAVGHYQHKRRSGAERLLAAIIPTFLFLVLGYVLLATLFDLSFVDQVRSSMQETQQLAERFGVDVYDDELITAYTAFLESLMTLVLLIMATVYAFIIYGGSVLLFNRIGMDYHKLPKFRYWEFPRFVLILYFLFWFLAILPFEAGSYMDSASQVGFFTISILLIIQALSLFVTYLNYKKVSKTMRVLLVIAALLSIMLVPILIYIVRIIGAFDMIFRIRDRLQT
ncbi:DUF2232 domain-containing protein [Shouchella patagoniensis]|uniref:DUF2232 domain-containing protein n=1 Tax=Shouchella patagoniensis TaxID=228576 RepID=UPI0009955227|nr:DUF2232 domain-containing protein [Shouchella patagoniensis]